MCCNYDIQDLMLIQKQMHLSEYDFGKMSHDGLHCANPKCYYELSCLIMDPH